MNGNDGSVICDVCHGQLFPGSAYEEGSTDTVFEVWPGWHACLACTRSRFEREHQASVREQALGVMRWRAGELTGMAGEGGTVKVSVLAMLAWEAAETVRDGKVDHATARAKLLLAAAQAGIDPVTARQVVASAFAEALAWARAA